MTSEGPDHEPAAHANLRYWYMAVALAAVCLVPLCWLLARLIWLPLFMGLFFFIVAGLLVGAVTFRMARQSRPLRRGQIIAGSLAVAVVGGLSLWWFEYQYFADSCGHAPRFAEAKNRSLGAGVGARSVELAAAEAFRIKLADRFPPCGPIGYARWSIAGSELELVVNGVRENVTTPHSGVRWLIRTLAAVALTGIGVYMSFDALRSRENVSNILPAGEPYEQDF